MLVADLREKRRRQVLRQAELARSTIRDQRSELARVVSSWNRIAKRVNKAIVRYERVTESVGLYGPERLQPGDLLGCVKACVDEAQTSPLDSIDETLKEHVAELRKAARQSARGRVKREKRRAKV